jgi:hypothetical protein
VTDAELRYIYVEIFNGRGNHGQFLRAFSEAFCLADSQNWALMRKCAERLVIKYNLMKYLDTFPKSGVLNE